MRTAALSNFRKLWGRARRTVLTTLEQCKLDLKATLESSRLVFEFVGLN
jgi:hypothetical protein